MIKLTKTGLGLLTAQYRSVLKKCRLINLGLFAAAAMSIMIPNKAEATIVCRSYDGLSYYKYTYLDECPGGETKITETGTTLGDSAIAIGSEDIAIGTIAKAIPHEDMNNGNIAMGYMATAKGSGNIVMGRYSTVLGMGNVVIGYQAGDSLTTVPYNNTITIGRFAQATGNESVAIGHESVTDGKQAVAIGSSTFVRYDTSIAIGNNARVGHWYNNQGAPNAVALGADSVANESDTVSVGHRSTDSIAFWASSNNTYGTDLFRRIVNVADGTDDHDAATVKQLKTLAGDGLSYNDTTGKYDVTGGSGGSYTAGTGISIDANNVISADTAYLNANYATKNSLNDYAKADDVYTKTEANNTFAKSGDVYTKTEINTTLQDYAKADDVYTKTEANNTFAKSGDVYTKTEINTTLQDYAKTDDVYTKTEINTTLQDYAKTDNVYTKTEINTTLQDYVKSDDLSTTLQDYAKTDDVYTKTEITTTLENYASKLSVDDLQIQVNGKQDALSDEQMAVLNSGISASDVEEVHNVVTTVNTLETTVAATGKRVDNVEQSIGDRSHYSEQNYIKNNESVASSLNSLDVAVGRTQKNLAAVQAANEARFKNIENNLNHLEDKMKKGLAASNALARLVPLSGDKYKTQLSIAMGGYENNQAAAIGGFHYISEGVLLNTGIAYGGDDNLSYGVGLTVGF